MPAAARSTQQAEPAEEEEPSASRCWRSQHRFDLLDAPQYLALQRGLAKNRQHVAARLAEVAPPAIQAFAAAHVFEHVLEIRATVGAFHHRGFAVLTDALIIFRRIRIARRFGHALHER